MGKQAIDQVFTHPGLKIMNHVVAGYPSAEISHECIRAMEAAGSDMIEIQIPFSDPMADGPTIVRANHIALEQGMDLPRFWKWLEVVARETKIPLLLMTYFNLPYQMGLENFFSHSQNSGISGIILPDIPFDNETEDYPNRISPYDLHPIQVISPSVGQDRLQKIASIGSGFVYTTLKVGITGSIKSQEHGLDFLDAVKRIFPLPIAAGFGIDNPEQVKALIGKADMAVIGSHLIRMLDEEISQRPSPSFRSITDFIKTCKQISPR